jgi:hypothetical protein
LLVVEVSATSVADGARLVVDALTKRGWLGSA